MRSLVLLCCLSGVVHADESPPTPTPTPTPDEKPLPKLDTSRLEALFTKATKHYDLGEWQAAIVEFKQLYLLMPDPSFLFNIGQAYRQDGKCREATAAYKSYLRNAPDGERAKVEQFITELAACVKEEDERARRLLPPPPPPPPGPSWPRKLRWSGYATGGFGVVLAGLGVWFSIRAQRAENDLEELCGRPGGCEAGPGIDRIEERGRDAERTATVFYIAGGVALATGATLWFLGRRAEERFTIAPIAGGAVASGRWTF